MSSIQVDNFFPFDSGAGAPATPARWRLMARGWQSSGVLGGYLNQMVPSLAGVVVTVGTGAAWIDGFYGEVDTPKNITTSGNGTVVARADPANRQIVLAFITTALTQNLTDIYEIPIARMAGGAMTDIRQFAPPTISPAASVARIAVQNIPNNQGVPVIFDTVYEGTSWYNSSTGVFTPPLAGRYAISSMVALANPGAGGVCFITVMFPGGGGEIRRGNQFSMVGVPNPGPIVSSTVRFPAGLQFCIGIFQASGAPMNTLSGGTPWAYCDVEWVGP